MPDFSRVINLAYQRILGRPADPGGLDAYNRSMNAGLTEADVRESLLRSAEYADKHPDRTSAGTGAAVTTTRAGSAKKRGKAGTKTRSKTSSSTAAGPKKKKKKKARARRSG